MSTSSGFLDVARQKVVVISKGGCHLCEVVLDALGSLSEGYGLDVEVRDILQDRELHDRYWARIPVVRIGGDDVFEARDMADPSSYRARLEEAVASRRGLP